MDECNEREEGSEVDGIKCVVVSGGQRRAEELGVSAEVDLENVYFKAGQHEAVDVVNAGRRLVFLERFFISSTNIV